MFTNVFLRVSFKPRFSAKLVPAKSSFHSKSQTFFNFFISGENCLIKNRIQENIDDLTLKNVLLRNTYFRGVENVQFIRNCFLKEK